LRIEERKLEASGRLGLHIVRGPQRGRGPTISLNRRASVAAAGNGEGLRRRRPTRVSLTGSLASYLPGGQCGLSFPVAPLHCLSPGPGAAASALDTDDAKAARASTVTIAFFVLDMIHPLPLPQSQNKAEPTPLCDVLQAGCSRRSSGGSSTNCLLDRESSSNALAVNVTELRVSGKPSTWPLRFGLTMRLPTFLSQKPGRRVSGPCFQKRVATQAQIGCCDRFLAAYHAQLPQPSSSTPHIWLNHAASPREKCAKTWRGGAA
jgi:hypothetical protein